MHPDHYLIFKKRFLPNPNDTKRKQMYFAAFILSSTPGKEDKNTPNEKMLDNRKQGAGSTT